MKDEPAEREEAPPDGAPRSLASNPLGPNQRTAAGALSVEAIVENPQALRAALPIGSVDVISGNEIIGWAWDPEQPEKTVIVEIVDADKTVVTVEANLYRPDLEKAGVGNGRYGFSVREIGFLLPNICHRLRIRRAGDHRELPGSPRWVVNFSQAFEDSGRKLIDDLVTAHIESSAKAEQLEDLLRTFVHSARRLLDTQRELLAAGAGGPGATLGALKTIRDDYPELALPAAEQPVVSVIIPAYNQFRLTYECIASIGIHLPEMPFEILIVDDGSTDETVLAGLILPESVRIERLRSNRGFIEACNRGAELAKGEFLLFLNNDTLVQTGWLDELVKTFERTDNVGIVGAQLLFEDGKIQDSGGIVWRLGDAWNWGRGADAEDPRFRYLRDVDYISGAALMIRKDLFLSLGGFDAYYAPAYYEDTDLAFRVREAGKRVVIQPASRIVHLEGASGGKDPAGGGVKRYQTINRRKFYQRWRSLLLQHRVNGEEPALEAERRVSRRAYFIDDCVPTPDLDAGSNAALQHMLVLISLGYKVTFLPADNMARDDPYTANLEKYGIECPHFPFYASVEQLFRDHRTPPDLIYLHRFSNAQKYAGMARLHFPDSRIVYNVADLHFLRMEREAAVTHDSRTAAEADLMKRRELSVMNNVDIVLAHSPYEVDLIKQVAPAINSKILGWAVPLRELKTPIERRFGIAFVGGFRHRPNVDAAKYLVSEIMPLIRRAGLPIRCHIGGSRMPREVFGLGGLDVEIVGFVPDLAALFDKVRCAVAPLRYGAGVKGKVLDSFAFGLPCVMTEIAAEGLDLSDDLSWLVARSSKQFAEKVIALHCDEQLAIKLSDACRTFIRDRFNFEVIRGQLQQILTTTKPANSSSAETIE